jgi:hypothetical protein
MSRVFLYVAIAVVFFVLGAWTFSRSPSIASVGSPAPAQPPVVQPGNSADAERALASLQSENAQLRRALEKTLQLGNDSPVAATATGSALEAQLQLLETFPNGISLETFSEGLKVTPEAAAFLGITPDDTKKVQQALKDARAKLDGIETKYLTITEQTPEKAVFEIKPYTEGAQVKDELISSLSGILGERRAKAFIAQSRGGFARQLSNFGDHYSTKVEIIWGKNEIKQTFTSATGTGSVTGPFETLPERYRKLITIDNP